MIKRLSALTLLLASMAGYASAANTYGIPDKIQDGNILHCFDWTFNDIKSSLPDIAKAGFGAVQVSPVQGNCATNAEWFYAYMPYDLKFKANGNGSREQLKALCDEAAKYGIKIIVDVVANHINVASGYRDPWWDTNGRERNNGGINYGDRYSITHNNLGGYHDVNSESTEVQERAKAFVEDLKSLGVKGIRWDAAKHIGLPSENCQFWPQVCSVAGMYHYGEILDGPGGNRDALLKEYAKYMSVTDSDYSTWCRNEINNGNVPSGYGSWTALEGNKKVLWGESHDNYSNEEKQSTYVAQDKIDRAWALGACRNGEAALYFSRPSATDYKAIKMGQKGSTHFTSKEIAAVNHFRNAAVGTDDYYTGSNGVASITRKGIGAVIIVGNGSSRQVSVTNGGGFAPVGTYVDEVSGNTFTVTSTTISGQVGSTGIAVIYDSGAAKAPSVTFDPAGGTFSSDKLTVKATANNATSAWYKIGSGSQVSFTGSKTFTVGEGLQYGQSVTVSWSATGDGQTKTGSVTYTKVDPAAGVYVYYNNPEGWSSVYCYVYDDNENSVAAWPGEQMAKSSTHAGWYEYKLPDAFTASAHVLFNNNSGKQHPAANEPGYDVKGKSMRLEGTSWLEGAPAGGSHGGNDDPIVLDLPDHLYILGEVNGNQWDSNTGVEMTREGNNFIANVSIDGYFSFTTALYATWNELNASNCRWGVETDTTAELDRPVELTQLGDPKAINYVGAGTDKYTIQVNWADKTATVHLGTWSGIDTVDVDSENATVEYYTLQGVRVETPVKGLYIRRQGNKVNKVIVR